MKYVSTRGEADGLDFAQVLLRGLAGDGGLYVPEVWPRLGEGEIADLAGRSYAQAAQRIIAPFVGDAVSRDALTAMIDEAYAGFRHPAVAPLVQIGPDDWLLELFHGRTLAFKDVAMQLLARLMDHVLTEQDRRATIIGATSGDTGGAAIEAFRSSERVDVFILYPHGRVSEVQRRQMTTVGGANVHALAIEGNFDDCQRIVTALFADRDLRDRVQLSGVNSINWARIVAQIVYYFTAAVALGAPRRKTGFVVPTGNFGDIFAGFAAAHMGLPIERLVIATNINDILARALQTGRYEVREVYATSSPSMDIQVSSNFERLLFEASGRDAPTVRGWMASLARSGAFEIEAAALESIRNCFTACCIDEDDCAATIADLWTNASYLCDPHTAIAVAAARRTAKSRGTPVVALSTAHPAKFPAAVRAASGVSPELPQWLADLHQRQERFAVLPSVVSDVSAYISKHVRLDPAGAGA